MDYEYKRFVRWIMQVIVYLEFVRWIMNIRIHFVTDCIVKVGARGFPRWSFSWEIRVGDSGAVQVVKYLYSEQKPTYFDFLFFKSASLFCGTT